MSYNFSTLNDKDLEELVRDILSVKLNVEFQSFKSGTDKGIDLRYSTIANENEIIVQVKHFLDSGLTKLKSVLKKQEAQKVKLLNPKRYIFVTSLPLSPQNKEEIKNIFEPFIHSTADVLGKQDLNNFLRNNPIIVENHFKLWLSGTAVLKRILHNGVHGSSEFYKKKINDQIKIFVPNKTHRVAVEILNKTNFILITGAPGIGKSTLADMLTYQLLAEGFELVYVREIREAENLYISSKKQVFYFDDFLGAITLDLKSSRNADSAIVNFIERIKTDKLKRLLLTCRTTILNQAKEESEKIENSKIEVSNHEVKIQDYSNIDKARILYNHIYFSNLSEELKSTFFKNQFYWKVIKHRHYNPRVIKLFTDIAYLQSDIDYDKEVITFLDDPSRIWEKPYVKQISNEARLFLSTLYSLGGKYVIEEPKLQEAYEARLDYETANNNYTKTSGIFNKTVKELLGGFVIRTHKTEKKYVSIEFRFLNPSIEDFLFYYFTKNLEEYFVILKSTYSLEQFKHRICTKYDPNSKRIYFGEDKNYSKLLKTFFERLPHLKGNGTEKDLDTVVVLLKLFKWVDIKEKVTEIMNNLFTVYLSWNERDNLIEIFDHIADNGLISEFDFSFKELFLLLSQDMNYYFQIEAFSKLLSKQTSYKKIVEEAKLSDIEFHIKFQNNINKSWGNSFDYYVTQTININKITNKNELTELIERRKQDAKQINELLTITDSTVFDKYDFDFDSQLSKNIVTDSENETQIKSLQTSQEVINESLEINRLFNSIDVIDEWDDFNL